ncbi:MAG: hypothetical protein ACI9DJ_000120 [Algoriphagus sp.]
MNFGTRRMKTRFILKRHGIPEFNLWLMLCFVSLDLQCFGQSIGIEKGLVTYYPILDGTLSDFSINGNDGIEEGKLIFESDLYGNKGGSISFNGKTDAFIAQKSSSINSLGLENSIGIFLWFKVGNWGSDGIFPLLMKATNFSKDGLSISVSSKGFRIRNRKDDLSFSFDIRKGIWYHLVGNDGQKDNNSMEWGFYLNNLGLMQTRNFMQVPDTSPIELYFGKINIQTKNGPETIWADEALDEIRVYNRVLNVKEIAELYSMGDRTTALRKIISKKSVEIAENIEPKSSVTERSRSQRDRPILQTIFETKAIISETAPLIERGIINTNTTVMSTKVGKYYALIIGNNDYLDPNIMPLDKPALDASLLSETLILYYNFESENVRLLTNARYEQTIEVLDSLARVVTPDDNFLMFYAGHGVWEENSSLGYWLPVDAKKSNKLRWLGNSQLKDYLKSINSRHTLLIANACFGGSIFKTRAAFTNASKGINSLYEMSSKKAMTSGNLKTVPDESMFLKYLIKRLQDNNNDYLSSDELFNLLE